MFVTAVDFAVLSGLMESLYRVDIGNKCDSLIPASLLRDLENGLKQAQAVTEAELGYALEGSFGYKKISIEDANYAYRFQIKPGTSRINIRQNETFYGEYSVSPFLLQNVEVTPAGTYVTVSLSTSIVANPDTLLFKDPTNGKIIKTQQIGVYPYRSAGSWVVALDKIPNGDTVHVIDLNYMYVDIPDEDKVLVARDASGNEITQAKPNQLLNSGERRYWFYLWSLLDREFTEANLYEGEFYKLLENISFWELTETEVSVPDNLEIELLDSEHGVIEAKLTDCSNTTFPYEFIVYYEYDPSIFLSEAFQSVVKNALCYLAAANLRLEDCEGCEVRNGFIREAQRPYTEVRTNTLTFEQAHIMKYGSLHGQLVYAERIASVPKYQILKKV